MQDLIGFGLWLLEVGCWCVFWYCIIQVVSKLLEIREIYAEAKEATDSMSEHLERLVHNVKPEKHADVEYWFDGDTDKFLAQGRDISEIRAHLKERFKLDVFIIEDQMMLMGPEYEPRDIKGRSPEEIAEAIAKLVVPKLLPKTAKE